MTEHVTGKCLCGAVEISGELTAPEIQACHCEQCQTWAGGSPYYVVRLTGVAISGEGHIGQYHASEHGERGFCKTCGTTLYWRMQGKPVSSMAAGLLAGHRGLRVTHEIFVDRRADWQPPFAGATQSTEAQEFARLAARLAEDN